MVDTLAVGLALSALWLLGHWLMSRRAEHRAQAASDAYWAHNATIPVEQRMGLSTPNLGGHWHFETYRERDQHERLIQRSTLPHIGVK